MPAKATPSSDCRFAFDRLGHRPNSLATIVAKDIEPILVRLDARPDVNQAALADIASAVTEVSCTRRVPDRRKRRIDTKSVGILKNLPVITGESQRVTYLEHDIGTCDSRRCDK